MPGLREAQLRMAAHLRDPEKHPAPEGVEERRLQVYRDLIYNNIDNFIRSGFPVLFSLYEANEWRELVRGFMNSHRCRSPLFPEISQEFLQYLMEEHTLRACDPPFMLALAHYEWVELALDITEAALPPSVDVVGTLDTLDSPISLSPLAWVLAYDYPVHRVGPGFQPREPEPTWLVVYRDRDDSVQFMALTAATARLLHHLRNNTAPASEALEPLAEELGLAPAAVRGFAAELLQQMLEAGVVFVHSEERGGASETGS